MARTWSSTGAAGNAFAPIDAFMKSYMEQYGIRGGAIAIARQGRIVHAKGYNNAEAGDATVMPTSLFRIASCSKVITGLMIHKLIEDGYKWGAAAFTLDTRVADLLVPPQIRIPGKPAVSRYDAKPAVNATPGKYFDAVTIRHLLLHQGGWDRGKRTKNDPTFYNDIDIAADQNGGKLPVTKQQVFNWGLKQPMQFYPGTDTEYSNYGYLVLGLVIEKLTGKSYINAVRDLLLVPLGIMRPRQALTTEPERAANEVVYYRDPAYKETSVMGSGTQVPQQYGAENIGNFDSFGGWIMSPVDYVKILAEYRRAAPGMPKVLPENLLTWNKAAGLSATGTVYDHGGMLPGTWSYAARRSDGVDFMVVWNTTSDKATFLHDKVSYGTGSHPQVWHKLMDQIQSWPAYDLTPAYFNNRSVWGLDGGPRYDGVWSPVSENRVLERGKTAAEFQKLYGDYYGKNMKLIWQQVHIDGVRERWDGIWAPNAGGQFVSWGTSAADFEKLYKEWWNKGFRLIHQQAFVKNGQTFYNGIWNPSGSGQFVSWEKTYEQFRKQYDEWWNKGFRLIHQQAYEKNGVTLYNGIWNPGTGGQFVTWEKNLSDFNTLYGQQWTAGFRLIQMQGHRRNGQVIYNGIWNPAAGGQLVSWMKDDELIDAENIVARSNGLQPAVICSY